MLSLRSFSSCAAFTRTTAACFSTSPIKINDDSKHDSNLRLRTKAAKSRTLSTEAERSLKETMENQYKELKKEIDAIKIEISEFPDNVALLRSTIRAQSKQIENLQSEKNKRKENSDFVCIWGAITCISVYLAYRQISPSKG